MKAIRDTVLKCLDEYEDESLLLPQTPKKNAYVLAERIRLKVEAMTIPWNGSGIRLTISGGISSFPQEAVNVQSLIQRADEAVQRAKDSGKNRIV